MLARVVACLALWPCVARAQLIDEKLESGNWAASWTVQSAHAGITLTPLMAAKHRGQFGVRLLDTEATDTLTFGTQLETRLNETSSKLYSRLWVRVNSSNYGAGGTTLYVAKWSNGVRFANAGGCTLNYAAELQCGVESVSASNQADFRDEFTHFSLGDAGWALLETATYGRGTDAGTVMFFANGRKILQHDNVESYTDRFVSWNVGEVYSYDDWQGSVDFDDVRVDIVPLASRFTVTLPARVVEGRCFAVTVGLGSSSEPGPVEAPYAVQLAVDAGTPLFSDPECATPVTGVPQLASGAKTAQVFTVAEAPGMFRVGVGQADLPFDFFPASASAPVEADDGGVPLLEDGGIEQRRLSYYGIRCSTGPGAFALLALVVLRRRSNRRPGRALRG